MIIYALIVRTKDGMALSATTDISDQQNQNLKETKKYVKMVANKSSQFPDRCLLKLIDYNIFMLTCLGVSYLVMCDFNYPTILAYSFLNELMREFATKYETSRVNLARRPYLFMEFDNFIHKTRQRYNKPQNLTTRINLPELSAEIKSKPPYELTISDVEPSRSNGYMYKHIANIPQLGVGPPPKLEPLAWYTFIPLIPSVLLICLGLFRGFSALQVSTIEEFDGPSPLHGLAFILESIFRVFQLYLLLYQSRYRMAESWLCLGVLFVLELVVWDLRDIQQQIAFFSVALALHLCTITRKLQPKLPDYNV